MKQWISVALLSVSLIAAAGIQEAKALQIDWGGQFWADQHWLNNYQLSRARPGVDADPIFTGAGGPYVPGVGQKNVVWYSMFLRLNPKLIVNDSINIKSQWHVGSPIYGFFGRSFPTTGDERLNFTGSQKDNFAIGAQRVWANLITDFGTIELGRAPIHWGLGAIWNSGDELFERFQSTGDMVRLTSKFGNFSISPSLVKIAMGRNAAGSSDAAGNITQGSDDITDYNLAVKYDNSEEDFELGMMWTKRTGSGAQTELQFNNAGTGSRRISYNLFDFYAQKKWGRWHLGGELPLFNGELGALDGVNEFNYKTFAVVLKGGYTSDIWDVDLNVGHVPGQEPTAVGDRKFSAVFLHKNYKTGLIMFNYNLYGLANNNPDRVAAAAVNSPYDNQIVNANYVALTPSAKLDKWKIKTTIVAAWADQVAQAGRRFYNYNRRQFFNAIGNQSKFMGWEIDPGVEFKWDENFVIAWDVGFFFPGDFYKFANVPTQELQTDMMFASQVRAGITF